MNWTSGEWFKFWCYVGYGGVVGALTLLSAYLYRSPAPTRLNDKVEANQRLKATDLRSADEALIIGRLTRGSMEKDSEIRPADVSDVEHVASPALAALAPLARPAGERESAPGDVVRLCLDGKIVYDDLKVEAATCDAASCLVTLKLPSLPKELQTADAARRMRAARPDQSCDN
jgi:hypothetical protein